MSSAWRSKKSLARQSQQMSLSSDLSLSMAVVCLSLVIYSMSVVSPNLALSLVQKIPLQPSSPFCKVVLGAAKDAFESILACFSDMSVTVANAL